MTERLTVWFESQPTANIDSERGRLRLTYTEQALGRFALGTPVLSLSLPVRPEPYANAVVRHFLDGLLPEGTARNAAARDVGVSPQETFGLIRELGRECAGALIIQPEAAAAPQASSTRNAEPITEERLAELVGNLHAAPFGIDDRVRLSLAGVQEKLLLTRMPDGAWGRPVDGIPSTHILKPEMATLEKTVENEAFCMRLAKHLGLRVANVETISVGLRELIVVERYDRLVHPDGAVDRIHQEDFCQATATPPEKKYEEDGGPPLQRIAEILQAVAPAGAAETLLKMTAVNLIIGNGDAHGKNFSLLHQHSVALDLAPLYDLMSTLYYQDDRLAMYVDNVQRTTNVTGDRLVNEAVGWGITRARATEVIAELLDAVPDSATKARDETPELPKGIYEIVLAQLESLRKGLS